MKRVQNKEKLYDEVPKELYDKVRISYNNKDGAYADWEYGNIGFLASYNGRFFDGGYEKTKMAARGIEIIIGKPRITFCLRTLKGLCFQQPITEASKQAVL